MDINKSMIILGTALAAILIVENMVTGYQAYTFIWTTKAWKLALFSIITGIVIGFGLRGFLMGKKKDSDENYDF